MPRRWTADFNYYFGDCTDAFQYAIAVFLRNFVVVILVFSYLTVWDEDRVVTKTRGRQGATFGAIPRYEKSLWSNRVAVE